MHQRIAISVLVVVALGGALGTAGTARAQEEPSSTITESPPQQQQQQPRPPAPAPAPTYAEPPPPNGPPPPIPVPAVEPPPRTIIATPAGHLRVVPSERQVLHWRRARIVSAFGTAFGTIGLGLSATSAIYVLVTDYPPDATNVLAPSAKPTDVGPVLAYTGASFSSIGFILSATGLGMEHHVLRNLGIDTDRGRFGAGTALGVFGTLSTGLSYFLGSTNYLDSHDQSIAILTTSIAGTVLCAIGSILYLTDSSRMKRSWKTYVAF